LNTGQRPKLDEFDDYNFVVLKMIRFDKDEDRILTEQLSIVFAEKFLLTFQEQPGDVFEPVRERIRRDRSRLRSAGTDYLAYALMDTIVDHYISTIELIGERIEDLEEDIFAGENQAVMEKIHRYKRDILLIGRSVRPAKEAISKLARLDNGLFCDATLLFVKDLQDHVNHACDAVETYRDLLTDQLNLYNSVLANKMNDVMKILTIFAAVFIPLTFIAGIYGTNFEYLPELKFRYSYYVFWAVLLVTAGCLLYYFKRKRWF
ncbi:MAG TPA: magnesium and cobalt transport protein CorA, partial [Desulfobacteraceae bacterium]|nr:magnesium and cobalt transport protein CorA [Desulfobacteraceae bacterium]